MSIAPPRDLEDAIRRSGEGHLIDWFEPRSQAIDHLRDVLRRVDRRARERLGADAPDLSEDSMLREFVRNSRAVTGLFQALGMSRSPDMVLMAWRIIQGMEIKEVILNYHRQESFEMRIVLESPYGEPEESYISSEIQDFGLLRHFGTITIDSLPVLGGFYPLHRG